MKRLVPFIIAICAYFVVGDSHCENSIAVAKVDADDVVDGVAASPAPALENLLKVSDSIYCGGQPWGERGFAELAKLGIKTVVSVDAARPDIRKAKKHDLRYVHIPIGYDGANEHAGLSLARVGREVEGPIYFHCHHGLHRGPVATAIASMAAGKMNREAAVDLLKRAGTSKDFVGLWRAVQTYRKPPTSAKLPQLVEVAEVDSLADAMASIDRAMQQLGQRLDKRPDPTRTTAVNDSEPNATQLTLLIREGLRESRRNLPETSGDQRLRMWLADAERTAKRLEDAFSTSQPQLTAELYQTLSESCARCHRAYRD